MLACCDIKDYYADQFSFVEYIMRKDNYSIFDLGEGASTQYDCYRTLSEVACRGYMATPIYMFMCSLLKNEQTIEDEIITRYFDVGLMKEPDEAVVTKFVEIVDPSKLQNLDVIRIDRADQLYGYEQWLSTCEKHYQFDQYATIAILLKVDDNFFGVGFLLGEMDGSWAILNLSSKHFGDLTTATLLDNADEYNQLFDN